MPAFTFVSARMTAAHRAASGVPQMGETAMAYPELPGTGADRCGGTAYQRPTPLGPRQIRAARFGLTRIGRRGLDPDEVRRFLGRVAGDFARLQAEVDRLRHESARMRSALRDWQSRYGNQGRFPHTGTSASPRVPGRVDAVPDPGPTPERGR